MALCATCRKINEALGEQRLYTIGIPTVVQRHRLFPGPCLYYAAVQYAFDAYLPYRECWMKHHLRLNLDALS